MPPVSTGLNDGDGDDDDDDDDDVGSIIFVNGLSIAVFGVDSKVASSSDSSRQRAP